MVRVKICGLTREEDVAEAVKAGADAVGFISGFPESPRNLSLSRVAQLMGAVPPFVDRVLVTTTDLVGRQTGEVSRMRPDALQLYGRDSDARSLRKKLGVKLIRPHLIGTGEDAVANIASFDALLSDTYVQGRSGGTGRTSDWVACRELRDRIAPVPFILSGGLNPDNVAAAVVRVRPFAVDASSGVEASPGIKDGAKVRAFVKLAAGAL
ncbi:MAG: phosphoribosylanthranilate isomerase [Thaumarchaeota archaeon]|nr:phosphoribosylanthranilate isomerase [Nitrososphaerota archaeon]